MAKKKRPVVNTSFEALRGEYTALWQSMVIREERKPALAASARRIADGRPRYDIVSKATGVPWYVVGIIHQMEGGLSWSSHLHNGDSLGARTHQEPAGRPAVGHPPFTWEESAIDALTMPGKQFDKITDWSLERIAYCLELYNGWGYRQYHPEVHSAYLWSFSEHYRSGKYISDGHWSSGSVSQQSGAMPLLKTLMDIDPGIAPSVDAVRATEWAKAAPPPSNLPDPATATAADLRPQSRKLSLIGWTKTFFGLGAVGSSGLTLSDVMEKARGLSDVFHSLVSDAHLVAGVVICVVVLGLAAVLEYLIVDDYRNGNWTPSRADV